ncbi:MAG TPA: hydrogenase maturation protease [Streptosporangiaceae bacterium]|nr:hydrogenase maturation protease [Streptosporangiaceae bacterium]
MTGRPGVVVIGLGNDFRRDDGAGPAVIERLRAKAPGGAELLISDGEPGRLMEACAGASLAIVVDAVRAQPPTPGRLHRIVADRLVAGQDAAGGHGAGLVGAASSHGLGLGDAIALASALGRLPERLIVHGVEADDLAPGTGLTPAVAGALDALTAAVLRDIPG